MTKKAATTPDATATVTTPAAVEPTTAGVATAPRDHLLSNDAYDVLKFVALILLPAIASVYFIVAQVITLPNPEGVVGVITAVDAGLGGLLKAGDKSYNASDSKFDGEVQVVEQDAKKVYALVLNSDPQFIDQAESILLKVKAPTAK